MKHVFTLIVTLILLIVGTAACKLSDSSDFATQDTGETKKSLTEIHLEAADSAHVGNYFAAYNLLLREVEMSRNAFNQLEQEYSTILRRKIIYFCALMLIVLALAIYATLRFVNRKRLSRNRISAQRISELRDLRAQLAGTNQPTDADQKKQSDDYAEFLKMERKILSERLFLQPNFNRTLISEQCGISRARVVQLIQDHSGCTPGDYVNRLKVEYSVQLIQEHPEWTIDAIAEAAGYANRGTYYQNFNKLYGMTPAQYRDSRTEK